MDEAKEMLKAILGRLEELGATVTNMELGMAKTHGEVTRLRGEVSEFRRETDDRLTRIEQRLDYLAEKWLEHDQEIWHLKRRQA